MRKDVKLGLAVGGILFGAVLVYILFFAGGNTAKKATNDQLAGTVGATTADPGSKDAGSAASQHNTSDSGTHSNAIETPKTGMESVAIGGPTTRPADAGATAWPVTGNTQTPAKAEGTGTETAAATGTWDWRQALDRGASGELISHSVTPGGASPGTAHAEEKSVETSWQKALTGSETATARPAASGAGRTYVVKPGDTLWSIAKAEYGSASYFSHIARANPKVNPSRVKAGTKLVLPAKDEVVPANAAVVLSPTTRPVEPGKEYRVQAGDNLNTICRRLYGSTASVAKLYELNKGLIGPNPSALKVNMVLQLPEAPKSTTGSVTSSAGTVAGSLQ